LHEAVQDAANKAKDEHGAGEYTVDEIKVDIVNPIREYRVVLRA
jgi:hypothetical protein